MENDEINYSLQIDLLTCNKYQKISETQLRSNIHVLKATPL